MHSFLPLTTYSDQIRHLYACGELTGCEDGKLWHPRKLAFSRMSLNYVVSDWGNERSRLQLFTQHGQFVRKISIRYIEIVAGLTINAHGRHVIICSYTGVLSSMTVSCLNKCKFPNSVRMIVCQTTLCLKKGPNFETV